MTATDMGTAGTTMRREYRVPHSAAPKLTRGVQCDIDCNDQTLHACELHDTRATTVVRPHRSNEQAHSTPLPERAEARLRHAASRPAPRSDPCARQRGKEHLPQPSARSRFLPEKARSGKCVFLSVGLLIFGRFSGPGRPGFRAPEGTTGERARGKARTTRRLKGHPSMQQASGRIFLRTFSPNLSKALCVLKKNATKPDNLRPTSGNRKYSPTWPTSVRKDLFLRFVCGAPQKRAWTGARAKAAACRRNALFL